MYWELSEGPVKVLPTLYVTLIVDFKLRLAAEGPPVTLGESEADQGVLSERVSPLATETTNTSFATEFVTKVVF